VSVVVECDGGEGWGDGGLRTFVEDTFEVG